MIEMSTNNVAGMQDHTPLSSDRMYELVSHVLRSEFPGDTERQYIIRRGSRLNFCCPYCGDSSNPRKKRGNVYLDRFSYKCYNGGCEKYADFEWFLKDFDQVKRLNDQELTSLKLSIKENRESSDYQKQRYQEANLQKLIDAKWDVLLVKRSVLMDKLGLWDIRETSPQGVYLKKRMQTVDEKFAWDNYRKRLFIFNLDKTGEWVFGMQIKQMNDPEAKYKTYNIGRVHEYFMKSPPDLIEYATKYNSLSTIFGILRVNMHSMLTIFEGPMDHFLYPNSVATCGIGNDWPLELDNKRWFQDNDEAGVKLALNKLDEGEQVFLWKKFFDENPQYNSGKRKDYTDIYIKSVLSGNPLNTLDEYFSEHKHDGIYL